MVDPTGVLTKIETNNPINVHNTEIIAEHIVTFLKFVKIFIEDIAGNIISAVISKLPTRFIASTIIVPIII